MGHAGSEENTRGGLTASPRLHSLALLVALDAFYLEQRRCDLEGGVEGDRVWMTCSRGAVLVRVVAFS